MFIWFHHRLPRYCTCAASGSRFFLSNDVEEVLQLVRDVQEDPQLIEVGERNNPVENVRNIFTAVRRRPNFGFCNM